MVEHTSKQDKRQAMSTSVNTCNLRKTESTFKTSIFNTTYIPHHM